MCIVASCSNDSISSNSQVNAETTTIAPTNETTTNETTTTEIATAETTTTVVIEPSFSATLDKPLTDFDDPVDMAVRTKPTPMTYLVERGGKIFEFASGQKGPEVLDISALTKAEGEQGLLGLAFSPDGMRAYINYIDLKGDTIIAAYSMGTGGAFDKSTRQVITTIEQPYANHNGGEIIVDVDGSLLIFTGDGGSGGDPERRALDDQSLLGKILKISPTPSGWSPPEVLAVGLRNPWRAAYDPPTNDLWVADVGQGDWEEINVIAIDDVPNVSFGWSAREGTHEFNADQQGLHNERTAVEPIYEYPHENGNCSISGGLVYRGNNLTVNGTWYVFSDYCSGKVQALCIDAQRKQCGLIEIGTVEKSVGIVADAQGELWVLSQNGLIVALIAD